MLQILCTLCDAKTFLGVFNSDLLPHSITQPGTIIVNCDPHTENGSHWLAINFQPKSFGGFYFDSYGLHPYIPSFRSLLKRTCSVWDFNTTQLQGLTSSVCGHYCCLFALYLDRGYSPKQFTASLTQGQPTNRLLRCSHRNSGLAAQKGTSGRSVLHLLQKEVSSGYCDKKEINSNVLPTVSYTCFLNCFRAIKLN
jgi:hypothetical protein